MPECRHTAEATKRPQAPPDGSEETQVTAIAELLSVDPELCTCACCLWGPLASPRKCCWEGCALARGYAGISTAESHSATYPPLHCTHQSHVVLGSLPDPVCGPMGGAEPCHPSGTPSAGHLWPTVCHVVASTLWGWGVGDDDESSWAEQHVPSQPVFTPIRTLRGPVPAAESDGRGVPFSL